MVNVRHSARAVILDEDDRILLCRFTLPHPAVPAGARFVWAAPGGGVESGETVLAALRRELDEEVGLAVDDDPAHVWRQEVVAPGYSDGYDGFVNDYFLIRTPSFDPRGALPAGELAAEHISGFAWWRCQDIAGYRGPGLFSPRDLATPLRALLADGIPDTPVLLGL
jgi:8-oxo-dGTP pyrophosphatase MutT (NUDIX family)